MMTTSTDGLMPLNSLVESPSACVAGIVSSAKDPYKSRGTDYVLAFQLTDPTLGLNEYVSGQIFRRNPEDLPVMKNGDIVFFKNVKVQAFNGRSQLMSTWKTVCDVIRGDTDDLEYRFQQNPEGDQAGDGIDLINTVRMLKRHYRKTQSKSGYVPPSETYGASRRPTLKQHEVIPGMFFDYYGEVLASEPASEPGMNTDKHLLFLTDFCPSQYLQPCGAEWLLPEYESIRTNAILPCVAWDTVAPYAAAVEAGQIVFLKNVLLRDRNGIVEAHLHSDRNGSSSESSRISVVPLDDPNVEDLLKRRAAATGNAALRRVSYGGSSSRGYRSGSVAIRERDVEAKHEPGQYSPVENVNPVASRSSFASTAGRVPSAPPPSLTLPKATWTIQDVLEDQTRSALPVGRYFVQATIVDFLPTKAADFAVPRCGGCKNVVRPGKDPKCETCASQGRPQVGWKYEYHFSLLLDDLQGGGQLPVTVSGDDARQFLGKGRPDNLYKDEATARVIHGAMVRATTLMREQRYCVEAFNSPAGDSTSNSMVKMFRLVFTSSDRAFL